jgi:hypothetical protein
VLVCCRQLIKARLNVGSPLLEDVVATLSKALAQPLSTGQQTSSAVEMALSGPFCIDLLEVKSRTLSFRRHFRRHEPRELR